MPSFRQALICYPSLSGYQMLLNLSMDNGPDGIGRAIGTKDESRMT